MFDESKASILPPKARAGDLYLAWTSTAPAGTWFQVYVDGVMVASVQGTKVTIPAPPDHANIRVGAVDASERKSNLSSTLTPVPVASNRAVLTWQAGTFLGSDLAGFKVYTSPTSGGPVDTTKAIADIPALAANGGYDSGTYDSGGYGSTSVAYRWTSDVLPSGSWTFAVASYDFAGNVDPSPPTTTINVLAMPRPPARNLRGDRLKATVNPTTRVPTLTWLASPAS